MMLAWTLVLLGCSGGAPSTPEDCAGIGDVARRDDCYAQVAPAVFRTDPKAGVALVTTGVSDQTVRDFIWLEVTRDVDPNTDQYCQRIVDAALKERCMVLVSRPHLHRGLVQEGKKPPKAPMGGVPPGAPPPEGAAPPPQGALPGTPATP